MRNFSACLIVLLLTASPALALEITPGKPAQIETAGSPQRKLQRGFLNIALAPLEFSHNLWSVKGKDSLVPTWITGSVVGIGKTTGRALAGVYELATFWMPYPANYEPLVKPEFAWEHLPPEPEKKK